MYHRIYRLAVRKVSADQIAITLDLPISVVKNVVDQFFSSKSKEKSKVTTVIVPVQEQEEKVSYLDIYILQRLRFSLVDINGMVTEEHNSRLSTEFDKILGSNYKTIALLMANVKAIDESGLATILTFNKNCLDRGRYCGILNPSEVIENLITHKGLDNMIPIFGTEKAFEESALRLKNKK